MKVGKLYKLSLGTTFSSDSLIFNSTRKYIPYTRLVCVHTSNEARNKLLYQGRLIVLNIACGTKHWPH